MKNRSLKKNIMRIHALLRGIQRLYGSTHGSQLTKQVWESYVSQKEPTLADYSYFQAYSTFTESHLPDHLERLSPQERAKLAPYALPRLPRGFCKQYVPRSVLTEGEKQRRKGKSDVLAPLHSLLVALIRFRQQSAGRLLSAYHEALEQAKKGSIELPLPFSYEEELVTVNHDARTVAEVQLEKRPVVLRFLLWDRQSWVQKHPDEYGDTTKRNADLGIEGCTEPQFFVQCLNPTEELLWFGNLIKYRLLQQTVPGNTPPEDAQQRMLLLARMGTAKGLLCKRAGILTPAQSFTQVLSQAISRTDALVFDAESLYRGVLFASALATIALTNGSRLCELLQMGELPSQNGCIEDLSSM